MDTDACQFDILAQGHGKVVQACVAGNAGNTRLTLSFSGPLAGHVRPKDGFSVALILAGIGG